MNYHIVNLNWKIFQLCDFGEQGSDYPRHLTFPWSVVVDVVPDSGDDVVMLANDCDNHRVIVTRLSDDHIEYQMDLISAEDIEKAGVLFCPRRICWDASRGILFVGSGYKSTKPEVKSERVNEATRLPQRPNVSGNVTVWRVASPRPLTNWWANFELWFRMLNRPTSHVMSAKYFWFFYFFMTFAYTSFPSVKIALEMSRRVNLYRCQRCLDTPQSLDSGVL